MVDEEEIDEVVDWARSVKLCLLKPTFPIPTIPLNKEKLEDCRMLRMDNIIDWYVKTCDFVRKAKYFKKSFYSKDKELAELLNEWLEYADNFKTRLMKQYSGIKTAKEKYKNDTKENISFLFSTTYILERELLNKKTSDISVFIFKKYFDYLDR